MMYELLLDQNCILVHSLFAFQRNIFLIKLIHGAKLNPIFLEYFVSQLFGAHTF